jgi:hypothetical protein
MLWPDVISHDLRNHFPEYDKAKHDLLTEIDTQDQEFRDTISVAAKQMKPVPGLITYWREVAATSYVEKCVGRGDGMGLSIAPNGYTFHYWGASVGASGGGSSPPRPSPDQIAGYRGYQSLHRGPQLKVHCSSLEARANNILHEAQSLSEAAQLHSEETILRGACDFINGD